MGTAVSGDSELIRITMVDYFWGGILIDNYVEPDVPMLHLNTKYSGVTWADIKNARRQGNILQGKAHARQAIWNYVGPNTLVVGHAVINDLRALKWIHTAVLDSLIMEEVRVKAKQAEEAKLKEAEDARLKEEEEKRLKLEAESGIRVSALQDLTEMDVEAATAPKAGEEKPRVRKPHNLSLKTLAKRYLDRDIQTKGKAGHDSLEDALAARDIVHCNVLMSMEGVAG
jgi:RNA exonuclease 1